MVALLDLGLPSPSTSAAPPRVLVCGDADFAYTSALRTALPSARILATAFEPEAELLARYPHAAETIGKLRTADVLVRCGVDARQLSSHVDGTFERVVFNLPQAPPAARARNQIQRHRALLRELCASASAHLTPGIGQLWITLLAGQGGTPLDPIARPPGDTWQLQEEASLSGLLVVRVASLAPPEVEALAEAGYVPTGRRNADKKVTNKRIARGLVVHTLQAEGGAARAVSPLTWAFDNSFWLPDGGGEPPTPDALLARARDALGADGAAHTLAAPPTLLDAYTRPTDGRRARTHRFVYSSDTLALSRERALRLNARVCEGIAQSGTARPRTPSPAAIGDALEAVTLDGDVGGDGDGDGLAPPDSAEPAAGAGGAAAGGDAGVRCGGRWKEPE